jgi:uncharacterized protein YgiB involved in biofilm formation
MMRLYGHMSRDALKLTVLAAACAGVLVGCGESRKDRPVFEGVPFRTDASVVDKKVSRAFFEARVYDARASLDGAREAARYVGPKYCIANYGSSQIDWAMDIDDPATPLPLDEDTLVLQGTCNP